MNIIQIAAAVSEQSRLRIAKQDISNFNNKNFSRVGKEKLRAIKKYFNPPKPRAKKEKFFVCIEDGLYQVTKRQYEYFRVLVDNERITQGLEYAQKDFKHIGRCEQFNFGSK